MAFLETQTITDVYNRLVIKRVNHANTETDSLLVNVSALNFGLTTINLTAGANVFKVGETLTSNTGATAICQQVVNATAINVINIANGVFGAANTITGSETTRVRVQSGAVAPATKAMKVARLTYNVGGTLDAKLQVYWQGDGAANNRTIAIVSGAGELKLAETSSSSNNNALNPTGNIMVTTFGWGANCHYTLVLDLGKTEGFSAPYLDQNPALGF